jgi:toxin ParE1/3/4
MASPIQIRDKAYADLEQIIDWYGGKNSTLAIRFVLEAHREFQLLWEWPGAGALRRGIPKRLRGLRSWPMKRFRKYLIFYIPHRDGIEIVRVLHGARNVRALLRES